MDVATLSRTYGRAVIGPASVLVFRESPAPMVSEPGVSGNPRYGSGEVPEVTDPGERFDGGYRENVDTRHPPVRASEDATGGPYESVDRQGWDGVRVPRR